MSIFTLRTGANAHPEGSVLQTITDQIETSGVYSLVGNDFKVQAQGTPDLTVKVLLGRAYIEAILGNTYPVRSDVDTNVSVPGNSSGNPRIDALVLYIDLSAAPNADASNVATLAIVQGTPAPSPVAPTDGTIQTSIGASNPFLRLANISVISGATSITNPDITDTRVEVVWVIGGVKNTKGYFNIKEQSASPGTPLAGSIVIYGKTDNKVYKKDDTGAESEIGSGGGGATDIITAEVPAGAINGVNDTFTTASNFATGTLRVYKNGVRMKGGGVDFAETGSGSFQMTIPPASGTIFIVDYFKVATVASQGSTSFIYNETPSGAINGSNLNFATIFPYIGGTLMVYRDGQLMVPGVGGDYQETDPATGLFDFFIAPATGSVLRVAYQKSLSVTGNADTIDGFHANSTPTPNQLLPLDGSGLFPSSVVPGLPWSLIAGTLTYLSTDDPTFVATTSVDLTGTISLGMRLRLVQTTTKYFIVTAITATTITLYGGTDYDLTTASITDIYYSSAKAPYGFPLDPAKWTVKVVHTGDLSQSSPVQNTWYNLGSISIVIPIGVWEVSFQVSGYYTRLTGGAVSEWFALSESIGSPSDPQMVCLWGIGVGGATNLSQLFRDNQHRQLNKTVATTYFLIERTSDAGLATIEITGSTYGNTIIEAICDYL